MRLTIPGNVPSQKNGKEIYRSGNGRMFVGSNSRVIRWKMMAAIELNRQFRGHKITAYPLTITLTFYFDNKRRHDLDNAAGGVMDALQASGVIEDDCVANVNALHLHYGGLNKTNPRVEILIKGDSVS